MDILISESGKNIHSHVANLIGARMMAFTFRPNILGTQTPIEDIYYDVDIPITSDERLFYVENITNPYSMLVNMYGKSVVKMILGLLKQGGGSRVYLAHDLDISGQLMASMLQYHLVREGMARDRIIRLALADIEYINLDERTGQLTEQSRMYLNVGFGEFYSESQLHSVLEAIRMEEQMMNGVTNTRAGYRKMFTLAHIEKVRGDPDYKVEKKNSGTNYATYMTNLATHYRKLYNKHQKQEKGK